MKRVFVSLSLVGAAAILLSGCAYDPYWDDGYYGPGYGALSPRQIAKMNDPAWCSYHPQHCAALRARAGYGPPPPPGYGPPPPGYNGASPPGYNGPPPQGANAPPQNMQQPPPQQQQ